MILLEERNIHGIGRNGAKEQLGSSLAQELQRGAERGQDGKVFRGPELFFDGDDGFEVQNADARAGAEVHLVRFGQELLVTQIVADEAEEIDPAVAGDEVQVAAGAYMALVGAEA